MEGTYFQELCRPLYCTKKLLRSWVKIITFEKIMKQSYPIHSLHLRADTEKLLWHHRLGHTCDKYLYNAQKYIYGVLKFRDSTSKVLDQCPTCIQAKKSKTPSVHGINRVASQPYQGLLIYFFLLWDDL